MRASHTRQVREVGNGGGGASWTWESGADYPYSVWNAMAQDAASFQLEGNVSYGSQRSEAWAGGNARQRWRGMSAAGVEGGFVGIHAWCIHFRMRGCC